MTAHILVVDAEASARKQLKSALEQKGYAVTLKADCSEALSHIKHQGDGLELVLMAMPADAAVEISFLQSVAELGLSLPVIVQLRLGGEAEVTDVMRAGAFDCIIQPASRDQLFSKIGAALKVLRAGKARLQRRARPAHVHFSSIISASQPMMRVVALARKAAHIHIPVVLEGESGTGKTLFARAIHSASDRASRPFVAIDCHRFFAQGAEQHSRGAAAPLAAQWQAKIQEAEGGTLYLREIGALPAKWQIKLLDLVAESQNGHRAAPRVISSTSKDLIEEVRAGRFREDLYYRLNVYPIAMPALRRRKEDIPHLMRMFCEHFCSEQRRPRVLNVTASALALLTSFDWPGNIRQLEHALFRAVTLSAGEDLSEADFQQIAAQCLDDSWTALRASGPELVISNVEHQPSSRSDRDRMAEGGDQVMKETQRSGMAHNGFDKGAIASINANGDLRPLAEIEEELIRFALGFYRGQMSQVARKLGIGRSTLYRKLKDYGIDPDDPLREVA